jgi:hypothetical protein
VAGPFEGNSIWAGFGGQCDSSNDGDPIVQYDKIADRWILTQFAVSSTPYLQCVAVSTSSDATGSYNRYAFSFGNDFPDYPKLGVWPDAYYISFNMFNGNFFAGGRACAFDRSAMLAGTAATQICFQLSTAYGGLLPSDLDGSTAPPAGSPNFFLAFNTNSLDLWKFHANFVTPASSTFTGPTNIPVAAFSEACGGGTCIPQAGTNQKLDSLADRLMYRLAYRNFGDHEALVVNHSVTAGTSVGVRWYELRSPNATPTVFQQGTYAPDGFYRWLASMGMDRKGNIAIGYSFGGDSNFSATYDYILRGDFTGDGKFDASDLPAMMQALTNVSGYKSTNNLTDAEMLALGDFDGDLQFTNADLQAILPALMSGSGSAAAALKSVPEPASFLLFALGFLGIGARRTWLSR